MVEEFERLPNSFTYDILDMFKKFFKLLIHTMSQVDLCANEKENNNFYDAVDCPTVFCPTCIFPKWEFKGLGEYRRWCFDFGLVGRNKC